MNGKDSTLISEAVVRVSYNPKYKSINGLPVNFAIEVSELVLSEYKATLKKRIATDRDKIYKQKQGAMQRGLDGLALGIQWKLNGIDWYIAEIEKD